MGIIYNIQRFSLHDGPGIRTTVFLKGCPLRCAWCHNPESQSVKPQLSLFESRCLRCGQCFALCPCHRLVDGVHTVDFQACTACGRFVDGCAAGALEIFGRETSPEEAAEEALRDLPFYESSGGGVTLSGGEPTMQADFAAELLARIKAAGVHTALETCGHAPWASFGKLLPHLDMILYDVKQMDSEKHKAYTGADNHLILDNLCRLCGRDVQAEIVVRTPVIPGYNDQPQNFAALADFLKGMERIPRVELLPYNELAGSKYPRLGMTYSPGEVKEEDGTPPDELCALLTGEGITAQVLR